ncbi:PREDICTED: alpha-ketoglutarate-dependent dioxygenase alkB homolog 7, mitochondrial [Dinoponera quadriceps]|uniref:Alpha-ketoglutarate-dependent dioxygenase alkB homolog 7, mitochondrial n=1 Tax=Dinoponera quadriceps TaxID=609295 RepID=A0A6P3X7C5_DINQU|nr:PREDICTED: alpha-ketoglutarate-dependent dioxygenase alkB homolog 7, mitochondrial [Dinoponera quadriceps]XP_014474167.1 PREDICTED: alpha-ketoglutarate-dependent dioxygenase alkB homolog 7, mitochondrial [Dinoponera quadriceps]
MAMTSRLVFRTVNRAFCHTGSRHVTNLNSDTKESDASLTKDWEVELHNTMKILPNFVSEKEEVTLIQEIEPYMKKLRYEFSHWDNAIHGYRETEWRKWNEDNSKILDRVRKTAFPPEIAQLSLVHILDLSAEGWIKPHVDSIRFCGGIIAGLSLLSDSVMRLTMVDHEKECMECFLLPRRSLYIMSGVARYKYNHEILKTEESNFEGRHVPKSRRISVICRSEPDPEIS